MLHLYESLGWWRAAVHLRQVHSAEEYNELHHLVRFLGGLERGLERDGDECDDDERDDDLVVLLPHPPKQTHPTPPSHTPDDYGIAGR